MDKGERRRRSKKFLNELGFSSDFEYFAIFPFSLFPTKDWSARNYAILINDLVSQTGLRPIVCCKPTEKLRVKLIMEISALSHPILAGDLTVTGIISLVAKSQLVVGGDSAGVNIGAALGILTVALYGPTIPVWSEQSGVLLVHFLLCEPLPIVHPASD